MGEWLVCARREAFGPGDSVSRGDAARTDRPPGDLSSHPRHPVYFWETCPSWENKLRCPPLGHGAISGGGRVPAPSPRRACPLQSGHHAAAFAQRPPKVSAQRWDSLLEKAKTLEPLQYWSGNREKPRTGFGSRTLPSAKSEGSVGGRPCGGPAGGGLGPRRPRPVPWGPAKALSLPEE